MMLASPANQKYVCGFKLYGLKLYGYLTLRIYLHNSLENFSGEIGRYKNYKKKKTHHSITEIFITEAIDSGGVVK